MTDMPDTASGTASRRRWRMAARAWGPPGNERLTSSTGLVLLILLAVETLTTLALSSFLSVHIVLAYLTRVLRLGTADWRRTADRIVAGASSRRAALGSALLAGVIVALATYPTQQSWLSPKHHHREGDGRSSAAKTTAGDLGSN